MFTSQKLSREQLVTKLRNLESEISGNEIENDLDYALRNLNKYKIELELRNRDLSDTKRLLEESKNRYLDLYDNAPVGYLSFDQDGNILEVNLTAIRMLGMDRESLIGSPFTACIAPGERRQFCSHIRQVFKSEADNVVPFERRHLDNQVWRNTGFRITSLRLRSPGDMEIEVQLESMPHLDPKTNTLSCRTMMLDVTEQKHNEKINAEREAVLSRMSRVSALGEMATTFAHELTQPLYAITTLAQTGTKLFASNKADNEHISQIFELISKQAQRAGGVIRSIREYALNTKIQRTEVNLKNVINEAVKLVSTGFENSDVQVDIGKIKKDICVYADRLQCEQVFVNLLMNAIDACKNSDALVKKVNINVRDYDERFIEIMISDSGHGINEGDMNRLFDSFFTTKKTGLGMGLSICRTIIESNGGKIWACNNPDHGATFHFTLPLALPLNLKGDNSVV